MTAGVTLRTGGRLVAVVLTAAALLGALSAAAVLALIERADVRPAFEQDELLVILAIGSDEGPPSRPNASPLRGRADGLHLIAVDTQAKRATIVNIPRDALWGGTRINSYLALGGPERQVTAVEDMTGIPIDYWALTSFHGLNRLVEELGGARIYVDRPMVDRASRSDFPETGVHRVGGLNALAFLRNRGSLPDGDFGRTRNHGRFMMGVHEQLIEEQSDLADLTQQIASFSRHTESNIPVGRLLALALLALEIDPADVHQEALTGSFGTVGGASIVHLQPGDAFERIRQSDVGPRG